MRETKVVTVVIRPDPLDGGYVAFITKPSMYSGVVSQGDSRSDALRHLADALAGVEAILASRLPQPAEPTIDLLNPEIRSTTEAFQQKNRSEESET